MTPFQEDLELRRAVFEKMGWTLIEDTTTYKVGVERWVTPEGQITGWLLPELPPVESQWEATAQYLVPFMREKGYYYGTSWQEYGDDGSYEFDWYKFNNPSWSKEAEIKDDDIPRAACEAFMEVKL